MRGREDGEALAMESALSVPLLRRDDLWLGGLGSRAVARAIAEHRLVVIRPGVHAWADDVAAMTWEQRMVVRARALALVSKVPPVFLLFTAAALLGLPLYGPGTRDLHVLARPGRPGGGKGVVRHDGTLAEDEVIEIGGLLCTSLVRTVADVARRSAYAAAVCIADAAIRAEAHVRPGLYLVDRAEEFRAAALEIVGRSGAGRARARRTLAFADGRAQLPGESVSRIQLVELGFAPPELQVHIPGPKGTDYWVDFGLRDVNSLGEFDGKGKYLDPAMRAGRTPAQVLDEEKQREDWIRGTRQERFVRWGSPHIRSAAELGARLAAFGIVPPRAPGRR
jgi:hypothetical protein